MKKFTHREDVTQFKHDPIKHPRNNLKQTISSTKIIFTGYGKREIVSMNPMVRPHQRPHLVIPFDFSYSTSIVPQET